MPTTNITPLTKKNAGDGKRNQWDFSAKSFPPELQLSLQGLESYYSLNYDAARAYVIDLATRRLRALQKKRGQSYLHWGDATRIADPDLLNVLRHYQHVRIARECSPWTVYVYDPTRRQSLRRQ